MTERIAVQFSATANFASLNAQIKAINAQLADTNKLYAASGKAGVVGFAEIGKQFEQSLSQLKGWSTQTVTVRSGVNQLTEDIKNQGYTIEKFLTNPIKGVKKAWQDAGAVATQQMRLQKSQFIEMSQNGVTGNTKGALAVPNNVEALSTNLEKAKMQLGVFTEMLSSSATGMINWGKNTQWAGRQLTYGLSVPLLAIGGLIGKMSFDLEDQQNKLRAVYGGLQQQSQQTLSAVSKASQDMALKVASQFGVAGKATMQLEAQLAGMGYTGEKLQTVVYQVSRLQALAAKGTVEQGDAINAAINLMNNFDIPVSNLEDVFNHLNAAENRTVLATNDIVVALPRAGQAVSALGGSWQDLVVLMAGMRAAGIPAAQAATALNRSLGSIVSPSTTAVKALGALGVNIQQIIDQNTAGGKTSIVGIFRDLGDQLKGLTGEKQLAAVDTLFSKFQGTRIFTAMRGLVDQTGKIGQQMKNAQDAVDETNVSAAANAQKDITARYDTTVGVIRRDIAKLGVELAIAGEPFLAAGAKFLTIITEIIGKFTKLPSGIKDVIAGGAIIAALTGPIVMMIGLFANLSGQIVKGLASIARFVTGFQGLEDETSILTKFQSGLSNAFMKETAVAEDLTDVVNQLSVAYSRLALAQEMDLKENGVSSLGGLPSVRSSRAGMQKLTGTAGKFGPLSSGLLVPGGSASTNEIEESSGAASKNWGAIAGYVGIAALGITALKNGTSTWADKLLDISFILAGIFPLMKAIWTTETVSKWTSGVSNAFGVVGTAIKSKLGSAVEKVGANVEGLGASIGAVAPYALAAGVALGGAFYLIHKHEQEIEKDQQALANGASTLATAVGANWNDTNKIILKTGAAMKVAGNQVSTITKTINSIGQSDQGKRLIGQIRGMNDSDATSAAQTFGMQMILGGATPKQVHDAIQALLVAAGHQKLAFNANITNFKFSNAGQVAHNITSNLQKSLTEDFSKINLMKDFGRSAQNAGTGTLPEGLTNQIKTAAQQAGNTFTANALDKSEQVAIVKQWQNYFIGQINTLKARIKSELASGDTVGAGQDNLKLQKMIQEQAQFITEFANQVGLGGDQVKGFNDILNDFNLSLEQSGTAGEKGAAGVETFANSVDQVKNAISQADVSSFTNDLQSSVSAGLSNLTSIVDSQYDAMTTASDNAINKQQQADDHAYAERGKAATTYYNYLASMAGKGYVIPKKQAEELFNTEIKGSTNVAKARKAAEDLVDKYNNGSETRLQKITDKYNDQIKALKNKGKAEAELAAAVKKELAAEEAEAQFQAGQEALNIDFNTSIDTGNLGQAAIDMAQAQANATQNALTQASDAAQAKATADKNANDVAINLLEKEKKAKLDALKAEDQARKVWLQNQLSAVTKEYDHEKTLNDNRLKAYQTSMDAMYAMRKTELDQELSTMTSMVPKNAAQMNDMIGKIEAAAHGMGINLNTASSGWAKAIKDVWANSIKESAMKVKNDDVWTKFGKDIADKTTKGIGMTWDQFLKWMVTGKLPNADEKVAEGKTSSGSTPAGSKPTKASHTGEYINGLGRNETPRILEHGEWVINKNAVQKYGSDYFAQLNDMKMHSGGEVNPFVQTMGMMMSGIMGDFISKGIGSAIKSKRGGRSSATSGGVGSAISSFTGISGGGSAAANEALGKKMAAAVGWTGANWNALNTLWGRYESGWRTEIPGQSINTAWGIPQADPGTKMATFGPKWMSDAKTQIAWGIDYIQRSYGKSEGPINAIRQELTNYKGYHQTSHAGAPYGYDSGGIWKSGSMGVNASGKPEVVFTSAQWNTLSRLSNVGATVSANNGKMNGGDEYNVSVVLNGANMDANDVADVVLKKIKLLNTKNDRVVTSRHR